MDKQQTSVQGTQIQYIGTKPRKVDHWCGSHLTWEGRGDVQTVNDPRVVGKLLYHVDVWRVYDPEAPLPTHSMLLESQMAAASGDTKTLLASLQVLLGAIAKNPAAQVMLGAIGMGASPALAAPSSVAERLAEQTELAVTGKTAGLRDDPLSAPPLPPGMFTEATPAQAAQVPSVPSVPAKGANVDERELLLENLRREARDLSIPVKSSWGPTALREAIAARRAQVAAAAEGADASATLAAASAASAAAKAADKAAAA